MQGAEEWIREDRKICISKISSRYSAECKISSGITFPRFHQFSFRLLFQLYRQKRFSFPATLFVIPAPISPHRINGDVDSSRTRRQYPRRRNILRARGEPQAENGVKSNISPACQRCCCQHFPGGRHFRERKPHNGDFSLRQQLQGHHVTKAMVGGRKIWSVQHHWRPKQTLSRVGLTEDNQQIRNLRPMSQFYFCLLVTGIHLIFDEISFARFFNRVGFKYVIKYRVSVLIIKHAWRPFYIS